MVGRGRALASARRFLVAAAWWTLSFGPVDMSEISDISIWREMEARLSAI